MWLVTKPPAIKPDLSEYGWVFELVMGHTTHIRRWWPAGFSELKLLVGLVYYTSIAAIVLVLPAALHYLHVMVEWWQLTRHNDDPQVRDIHINLSCVCVCVSILSMLGQLLAAVYIFVLCVI